MYRVFIYCFLIWSLTHSITAQADTIDVWIVKRNGLTIINSNQMLIVYDNRPMEINISSYADSDTLQIIYWTDSGLELNTWFYTFKDTNNVFIDKFTNPIDSTIRCFPTPCTTFHLRKNYIEFRVDFLRAFLNSNSINKIIVEFEFDNKSWSKSYIGKAVCVISSNF